MKAMLSDRFSVADPSARPARTFAPRIRRPRGVAGPARLLIVGLTFAVAGVAAILLSRGGIIVRPAAVRTPLVPGAVTYAGVGYQLAGHQVSTTIRQPGGNSVSASGIFEIVSLRLQAADHLRHLIASDLLALDAGGTYYGVSTPEVLGLTDRRWGALAPTTVVPAVGSILVRAVFDVPPGVPQRRVSLHIGQFDYVDQAPAQTLDLPACCGAAAPAPASREHAIRGPLSPNPVLG
jgi:hypothetical protein